MKTEVKVGIFIFLAIISLFILTFQVGVLDKFKRKGYIIYGYINDVSGLSKKAKVKMRGVVIGDVEGLQLKDSKVLVTLFINEGIKIPIGSKLILSQDNMLGGKYLRIIPSEVNVYYKPKDIIKNYIKVASLEDVLNNINETVNSFKNIVIKIDTSLDKSVRENIKSSIQNLKESSQKINSILSFLSLRIPQTFNNIDNMIYEYKTTGKIINKKIPIILDKGDNLLSNLNNTSKNLDSKIDSFLKEYKSVANNLNNLIKNSKQDLNNTLKSANLFFKSGSDSFKKVDNLLASYTKSSLLVDVDQKYYFNDNYFSSNIDFTYVPKPSKYYIVGITSKKDISTNKEKVYLNAQYGKRFNNILLRGGIINNQGGLGIDYFAKKDKLKFSTNLYDFNSENDKRGKRANLGMFISYLYLKHIRIFGGVDNILNQNSIRAILGIGIHFKDNDLKPFIQGGASFLK